MAGLPTLPSRGRKKKDAGSKKVSTQAQSEVWQSTWYGSMTWLGSVGDYSEDVRVSICDRLREAFTIQYPDSRELDLAALEANIRLSRRGVESITPEEVHLMRTVHFSVSALSGEIATYVFSKKAKLVKAVQSEEAESPSEIISQLPQQESLRRDIIALLEYMLNVPSKANVYIYLVPENALIQVSTGFQTTMKSLDDLTKSSLPLKPTNGSGTDDAKSTGALTTIGIGIGQGGVRDVCYWCRASVLHSEVKLEIVAVASALHIVAATANSRTGTPTTAMSAVS
eukprot:CAMPEP_0118940216 /NCGR_PEP_ID=MMETSP1169-20130426/30860_1 /TAXON_ID=36882 /ORGANISM="Pyramimonas obovata, Strain CCMP722" /LENGTH=283 /DNA_ID=CAMNT_0006884645 /DNA_START=83 /DNA_END=935 /DNA_ORIENTATION=+